MFLLRDLVSPRSWLAMISHLAGLFMGIAVLVVIVTGLSLGFSLLVLALVGLPILGLTLRAATLYAVAERARLDLMLGVRIPAWPADSRAGYRWGIIPRWRALTERATWGEIGYGLLRLPVSAIAATLSIAAWSAALVLLTLPLYNRSLPSGGAKLGDTVLAGRPTMVAAVVIGLVLLLAAPQLTRGLASADAALSRRLLGPRRDLAARVRDVEISRERVLDAALSGLAALCPVPVDVHVDVPVRPKSSVEAVAYFMVAEALTNVAKHSRASHAKVVVEGHGYPGTLTVMISDDGIGGADNTSPGLSGLADRVAGVDGRLSVESPAGGPTIIAAELPCG